MYRICRNIILACLIIQLLSCKTTQHLSQAEVNYHTTDKNASSDSSFEELIRPYRAEMAQEMEVVIGQLEVDLVKGKPNSSLGSWFADVLYEHANQMFFKEVDLAMQNYGGLRIPYITAGDVTKRTIYELMPFDNTLVVLELKGPVFKRFIDEIAYSGGCPLSRNINFTITDQGAEDILVKGIPFHMDSTYRVAIPDYVARGGDKAGYLREIELEDSGVYIRDIIITHIEDLTEQGKSIVPDTTKRIRE